MASSLFSPKYQEAVSLAGHCPPPSFPPFPHPAGGLVFLWTKFGKDSEVSTDSELAKASKAGTDSGEGRLPRPGSLLCNWGTSPKETQPADILVLPPERWRMDSSSFVNKEWVCV